LSCFAVAAPGLEPIVARELRGLGEQPRVEDGGVSWTGDARSVMRANLWLRTATRVLVRVAKFNAKSFAELERAAKRVAWARFLPAGSTADFRVTSRKSKLIHTDAIAERLLSALGSRPEVKSREPKAESREQLFVVRVLRDEFEISADTSGELLHVRGYRQAIGKAPLRETLAAALLLGAEWSGDTPLLDPFCGSGTIPIEAALIARRIAPGVNRRFAVLDWPDVNAAWWTRLIDDAKSIELPKSPVAIVGSDRDKGAIASAVGNAERAGVAADIEFTVRAVSAIEPPATAGLVATNPPYGVRASPRKDVRNLYAQFGNVMRAKCAGWRVAFYSAQQRHVKETGLATRELFKTTNGGIDITANMSS
jgi:putative N6-adenine-specific DNA methylase